MTCAASGRAAAVSCGVPEDVTGAELDRFHELGVRAIRLDLFARRHWAAAGLARLRLRHGGAHDPARLAPAVLCTGHRGARPAALPRRPGEYVRRRPHGLHARVDGLTDRDAERLLDVLRHGCAWFKLSGPYRIAKGRPVGSVAPLGRALVQTRPDRLIWGSDWPHLPDGRRDTGELLALLADWAPDVADRHRFLVTAPSSFFAT